MSAHQPLSGLKRTWHGQPNSVENDPKPKIGEHKVVRYLVGPPGGQNEDTRWWTFAFWAHRKAFSRKRL
jgi:hypothetical protein